MGLVYREERESHLGCSVAGGGGSEKQSQVLTRPSRWRFCLHKNTRSPNPTVRVGPTNSRAYRNKRPRGNEPARYGGLLTMLCGLEAPICERGGSRTAAHLPY